MLWSTEGPDISPVVHGVTAPVCQPSAQGTPKVVLIPPKGFGPRPAVVLPSAPNSRPVRVVNVLGRGGGETDLLAVGGPSSFGVDQECAYA